MCGCEHPNTVCGYHRERIELSFRMMLAARGEHDFIAENRIRVALRTYGWKTAVVCRADWETAVA